jgi:hypothetical protein
MGKITEYELVNMLALLEQSPYAFAGAEPFTPIKDIPPAVMSSNTEYSINKGIGDPVLLVKRPAA